jgi:transcriptional regulator GlxA family with amidase domain
LNVAPRAIGLLAYDDMQALDLVGPLDVCGAANARAGGASPHTLHIVGVACDPVRAENGLILRRSFRDIRRAYHRDGPSAGVGGRGPRRVGRAGRRRASWCHKGARTLVV